ncbi:hypothetical protein ACFLT7_02405 [candidate division KSB1 bacterium]
MIPVIILVLLQVGVLWLVFRQLGRNLMSVAIAVLAVLNACPWFTTYETAEPFFLGQPWWLSVWMISAVALLVLLYIRLFRMSDKQGTEDLPELWARVRKRLMEGGGEDIP